MSNSLQYCIVWCPNKLPHADYVLNQGLCQDFKTARPTPAMIPKQPVQPVLGISIHIAREPGSDPVLREKKEYSTKEASFYTLSTIIVVMAHKVTRIHTFRKQYKDFYYTLQYLKQFL